jgi:hypothetical protein
VRFYLDLKRQVSCRDFDAELRASFDKLLSAIDGHEDWTRSDGADYDSLVQEMVAQLPRLDADRFLRTVEAGFRSPALSSGLTVNMASSQPSGDDRSFDLKVRIFTSIEREAQLPTIGLETTNLLLDRLPGMRLAAMIIWKDRNRDAVLEGDTTLKRAFWNVVRNAKQAALLALFSTVLVVALLTGAIFQEVNGFSLHWLGSDAIDWFKRLIGPLTSTFIAAAATLWIDYRAGRRRRAYWKVGPPAG